MKSNTTFEIIRLSKLADDKLIKSFDCGDSRLNDYFINEALNLDEENFLATNVYMQKDSIKGFYTTSASTLTITNQIHPFGPPISRETMTEFAAIKIQYFAVDLSIQNSGLGKAMMFHLLSNLLVADLLYSIGFKVVYLEALSEATDFYTALGFSYLNPWEENNPILKSSLMFINYDDLINYYYF
ncbi:GNAT family N-acetyltransferase [Companilactobacillus mishanensis]|uniref:GNAT family N-acetyltransferase n=1 Tax=Companilactobacillus mishanensis TaxID=2486008 RepID=UPI00129546A2|nr:GNAT family N-acetyltransferase [Companilactobacillus mishanensis]MQS89264.1 GNAT family N-acetyltransferase [Companilactobacillus mishanensis]